MFSMRTLRGYFLSDKYSEKEKALLTLSERSLKKWKRDYPESGPCSYFNARYKANYLIHLENSSSEGFGLTDMQGLELIVSNLKKVDSKSKIEFSFTDLTGDKYVLSVKSVYDDGIKEKVIFDDFSINFEGTEIKEGIKTLFGIMNGLKVPIISERSIGSSDDHYIWAHCVDLYELTSNLLGGGKINVDIGQNEVEFVVGIEPLSVVLPFTKPAMKMIFKNNTTEKERIVMEKYSRYKSPLKNYVGNKGRDSDPKGSPCDWITNKYRMTTNEDNFIYIEGSRIPSDLNEFRVMEISDLRMNIEFNLEDQYRFPDSSVYFKSVLLNNQLKAVSIYWISNDGRYLFGSLQRVMTNEKLKEIQTCFYALHSGAANGFLCEYKSFSGIKCIHLLNPIEIFDRLCLNVETSLKVGKMLSRDYFVASVEIGVSRRASLTNNFSIRYGNNFELGVHLLYFYNFTGECDFSQAFPIIPSIRPMKKSFSKHKYINKSSMIGRYLSDLDQIFAIFNLKRLNSYQRYKKTPALLKTLEQSKDLHVVLTEFENYVCVDSVRVKTFIEVEIEEIVEGYKNLDQEDFLEKERTINSKSSYQKDTPLKTEEEILEGFSELGLEKEDVKDQIEFCVNKLKKSIKRTHAEISGLVKSSIPEIQINSEEISLFLDEISADEKSTSDETGKESSDSLFEPHLETFKELKKNFWVSSYRGKVDYYIDPNRKPLKVNLGGEFDIKTLQKPSEIILELPRKDKFEINLEFKKIKGSFMRIKSKEREKDQSFELPLLNRFEILNIAVESMDEMTNDKNYYCADKNIKAADDIGLIKKYRGIFKNDNLKRGKKSNKKVEPEFPNINFSMTDDRDMFMSNQLMKKRRSMKKSCKNFFKNDFIRLKKLSRNAKEEKCKGTRTNCTNFNIVLDEVTGSLKTNNDAKEGESKADLFDFGVIKKNIYTDFSRSILKKSMFLLTDKVRKLDLLTNGRLTSFQRRNELCEESVFHVCRRVKDEYSEILRKIKIMVDLSR